MNQAPALPFDRPALTLLSSEPWRAAWEFVSHQLTHRNAAASGDGHPVILFPGLGADGRSLAPLRKHCQSLGYNAFDWGQGYNTGPHGKVEPWIRELAAHTADVLAHFDQSATLVGWSLGGLYARELAKLLKPRVRQVITIGTPFNAVADHTNVGWLYRLLSGQGPEMNSGLKARLRRPPPVPTTSIYSRADGLVAWQSCRHAESSRLVQDIEVGGSHLGMGWNPTVMRVVADRLAQRPGQWRPYTDGDGKQLRR